MGNINTQFGNLCVYNLIRTAKLRTSKTAAHFRNTLGLLRGFDNFRVCIFILSVHIEPQPGIEPPRPLLRHGGMSLLRRPDSNGDYRNQNPGCCRYTTAQFVLSQLINNCGFQLYRFRDA